MRSKTLPGLISMALADDSRFLATRFVAISGDDFFCAFIETS